MEEKSLFRIAGHTLCVEGTPEVAGLRHLPGFPIFRIDEGTPEWTVRFGCDVKEPEGCTVLSTFEFEEGVIHSRFERKDGVFYYVMEPDDSSIPPMILRYAGGDSVEASRAPLPAMLRFSLWMSLGMMSLPSKMLLIHSSTIVHQNRAVLFLGESGTGKSTHTRLWLKNIPDAHLLNDDSPVLAIENGTPVVYGSPWSGKTHCYHPYRFPLAAAVRLSQAPHNRIRRLDILEAVAALQPSCPPALAQDDHFADGIMDIISDTIAAVPVFHLECLPDADAARTSHNAIFGGMCKCVNV